MDKCQWEENCKIVSNGLGKLLQMVLAIISANSDSHKKIFPLLGNSPLKPLSMAHITISACGKKRK